MNSPVIVDTSVIYAALLSRHSRLRQPLLSENRLKLFIPRFVFVELFKHKERIVGATSLPESELLETLHAILTRLKFIDEALIPVGDWIEARRLCREVDAKDAPFVALALHLHGQLWTGDDELKRGLLTRGFDQFFSPPQK